MYKKSLEHKLDMYILCFVLKFGLLWRTRDLRKTPLRKSTKNDKNWRKRHQNWRVSGQKIFLWRFIIVLIGIVLKLHCFIFFHIHLWHFVLSTRFNFFKSIKIGQNLNLSVRQEDMEFCPKNLYGCFLGIYW